MLKSAEALERLRESQNEPVQWLLGDLLVSRAGRPDWHECRILQQLAVGSAGAEGAWNGLIGRFRQALANPNNAPMRAKEILNPAAADFDAKLDDLVAEMVAVVYLSGLGYSKFDFCPSGAVVMPDLHAFKDGKDAFIEVKNLREPPSLTLVAFSRWHANRARNAEAFAFEVMLEYRGIDPDLNREQKEVLERLIDKLPGRMRPDHFSATLPGGIEIAFSLRNGHGVMMTHGPGGPLGPVRIRSSQNLTQKLMAPAGKALSQLYGPAVPLDANRVIILRWKVPDDEWLVEEDVRTQVGAAIQQFLGQLFPHLEVHLMSSHQHI